MTNKYHNIPNVSIETALEAVRQALNIGESIGVKVSVTVVDHSMNLIAFGKADGATPHSTETSLKKANTAVSTGKATGWMSSELAVTLPLATNNKLTNVGGGIPIKLEGKLVGGLGIAGGTVEQDTNVASKTAQAIESEV